jgi:hypothetical protein
VDAGLDYRKGSNYPPNKKNFQCPKASTNQKGSTIEFPYLKNGCLLV